MHYAILGFKSLNADSPSAVRRETPAAVAWADYSRMKAARLTLDGCPVVELWSSDRGFIERYLANQEAQSEEQAPKPQSEPIKSKPHKMKKSLLIVAATLLSFASVKAQEPIYAPVTVAGMSSARFAVGITNLTPIFIDVRKQHDVMLQATTQGTAAVTNIFLFGFSVDGTSFSTNAPDIRTWAAESLSTFATTRTTNIACGGAGYLVLFNCHATLINTNTLKYGLKISAP